MRKVLVWMGVLLLSACANQMGETEARYGRVEKVESVMIDGETKFGIGTVIGAVAGGLLGNQIGGGTGRTVATVAGVAAGGYAGSKVEAKSEKRAGQQITVKLDSGGSVGITQPGEQPLRVGDRVRIDGSGDDARVVRQ